MDRIDDGHLCTRGEAASQRTDVRDAFVRHWHRANRWNVALSALAVEKKFLRPLPTMDAAGMMRTTVMKIDAGNR